MTEYSNVNRGSIWKNEKKSSDTHPDFTGSLNVDGVDYFVDAWKRKEGASDRAPPLSFKVKRKDKQASAPRRPDPISSGLDRDQDGDVPF